MNHIIIPSNENFGLKKLILDGFIQDQLNPVLVSGKIYNIILDQIQKSTEFILNNRYKIVIYTNF